MNQIFINLAVLISCSRVNGQTKVLKNKEIKLGYPDGYFIYR